MPRANERGVSGGKSEASLHEKHPPEQNSRAVGAVRAVATTRQRPRVENKEGKIAMQETTPLLLVFLTVLVPLSSFDFW